jgi:hypothetical protein
MHAATHVYWQCASTPNCPGIVAAPSPNGERDWTDHATCPACGKRSRAVIATSRENTGILEHQDRLKARHEEQSR